MSDKSSTLADRLEAFIPRGDGYNSDYANTLLDAVEALRGAHAIPEGYALVPVEPTPAMIQAGILVPCTEETEEADDYRAVYKAMLAAAQEVEN